MLYNSPVLYGGMGDLALTKLLHPRDFHEPFDAPVRTLLVLRAWTVWRARNAGFADARPDTLRKHIVDEEEACIERSVRALCEPCRLLGDATANTAFTQVAPDLVARLLRATP